MPEQLQVLIERRNWLTERIKAKERVGWDRTWDVRERDALSWGIEILAFVFESWLARKVFEYWLGARRKSR